MAHDPKSPDERRSRSSLHARATATTEATMSQKYFFKATSIAFAVAQLGVLACSRNDRDPARDQPSGAPTTGASRSGGRPAIGGGPRSAYDGGNPERENFGLGATGS